MAFRRQRFNRRKRPMRRRRTFRRRNFRRRNNTTTVNNGISPISQRFITKLKYHQNFSLTIASADTLVEKIFYLNSINQPDAGSGPGAHQPYGRDQLNSMYNKYRVFATSWRLSIEPNGFSGTAHTIPVPNEQVFAGADTGFAGEVPLALTKSISVDQPTVFTGRVNLPRLNGQTSAQYKASEDFDASYASNPTELNELHVLIASNQASSQVYNCNITLVYHVESFDPKTIAQS